MSQTTIKILNITEGDGFPGKDGDYMTEYLVEADDDNTYSIYRSGKLSYVAGDKITGTTKTGKRGNLIMNKISKEGEKKSFSKYNDPEEVKRVSFSTAISLCIKYLKFQDKHPDDVAIIIKGARIIHAWIVGPSLDRDNMTKRYHAMDEAINCLEFKTFKDIDTFDKLSELAEALCKPVMEAGNGSS